MAENVEKLRADALKFMGKNRLDKALSTFQELLQVAPNDTKAWVSVGDILAKLGHTDQAIKVYSKAAAQFAVAGELARAISINKAILALDPKHQHTQRALAALYSRQRGNDEARAAVSPRRETAPDSHAAVQRIMATEIVGPDGKPIDAAAILERLPYFPLFSSLDRDAFGSIITSLKLNRADPGEMIVAEDDNGDSFYLILNGDVHVRKAASDGTYVELARLRTGEFFGEFSFLTGAPRSASVFAGDEGAEMLEFSREGLASLAKRYPAINETLEEFYRKRLVGTLLKLNPIFRHIPTTHHESLLKHLKLETVPANTRLISQGEPSETIYLILSGAIAVTVTGHDGGQTTVADLGAGDMIGEIGVLTNRPATATCTTETQTRYYALSGAMFRKLAEKFPDVQQVVTELAKSRLAATRALISSDARISVGLV